MDETLLRRLVGLATLAIAAFLLSWLLPRPGLQRLQGERVVTMDLSRADSQPEEQLPGAELETPGPAIAPGTASVVPHPDRDRDWDPADRWPEDAEAAMPPESAEADEAPAIANPATAAPAPEPKTDTKPGAKTEPGAATSPPAQRADPAPTPPRKPDPATPAPRPAPKPASSPAVGGGVQVQAGAYSFLDKAEGVVARARSSGVSCLVSPAETSRGTLYRVRCGPYSSREDAAAAVKTLAAASIAAQVVSGAGR